MVEKHQGLTQSQICVPITALLCRAYASRSKDKKEKYQEVIG